jgi:hypothetical protein
MILLAVFNEYYVQLVYKQYNRIQEAFCLFSATSPIVNVKMLIIC